MADVAGQGGQYKTKVLRKVAELIFGLICNLAAHIALRHRLDGILDLQDRTGKSLDNGKYKEYGKNNADQRKTV